MSACSATWDWALSVNTDSSFSKLSMFLSPWTDETGSLVVGPWDLESAEKPRTQNGLVTSSSIYLLCVLRAVVQCLKT